jgi:hypothetical protein
MNRRGLLGMFAAGVAAAVLPSGVIMPVRAIIVPKKGDTIRFRRYNPFGDEAEAWESLAKPIDAFGQRGFIQARFVHVSEYLNAAWVPGIASSQAENQRRITAARRELLEIAQPASILRLSSERRELPSVWLPPGGEPD